MKSKFLIFGLLALSYSAFAEDFVEPSHFGAVVMITADGSQFGGTYLTDNWSTYLTVDGNSGDRTATTKGVQPNEDIGVTLRFAKRWNMGSYNFLNVGLHYHENFWGKDDNGATKNRHYGPSLGFERVFPNSNIELSAFVLPFAYDRTDSKDADGNDLVIANWKFFQVGGVGINYMF